MHGNPVDFSEQLVTIQQVVVSGVVTRLLERLGDTGLDVGGRDANFFDLVQGTVLDHFDCDGLICVEA